VSTNFIIIVIIITIIIINNKKRVSFDCWTLENHLDSFLILSHRGQKLCPGQTIPIYTIAETLFDHLFVW
jgi:hypothetical protein